MKTKPLIKCIVFLFMWASMSASLFFSLNGLYEVIKVIVLSEDLKLSTFVPVLLGIILLGIALLFEKIKLRLENEN